MDTSHYELTDETILVEGDRLYRIRATRDSLYASEGDLGGFVRSLVSLSANARVHGDARVSGNARVYSNALGESRR